MPNARNSLFKLDVHYKIYIALVFAAAALLITWSKFSAIGIGLFTWSAFSLAIIILDWIQILVFHPREVRKIANLEDVNRTLIFILVIGASLASLIAILFLLKSSKETSQAAITGHVMLSMGSVIVSWWLVHTIFTMHYAHLYYTTHPGDDKHKPIGGLQFPGHEDPDYLDFVYFSFVLGTTFQVSDVEISSRRIRRLALVHGLIAFAFNTAILALSINVVSSLISH